MFYSCQTRSIQGHVVIVDEDHNEDFATLAKELFGDVEDAPILPDPTAEEEFLTTEGGDGERASNEVSFEVEPYAETEPVPLDGASYLPMLVPSTEERSISQAAQIPEHDSVPPPLDVEEFSMERSASIQESHQPDLITVDSTEAVTPATEKSTQEVPEDILDTTFRPISYTLTPRHFLNLNPPKITIRDDLVAKRTKPSPVEIGQTDQFGQEPTDNALNTILPERAD